MNVKWSQSQFWRDRVPEPGIFSGAARDFAREASAIAFHGMAEGHEKDRARSAYEGAILDSYTTGAVEMAKAITTGEFVRESWARGTENPTDLYAVWFKSLPAVPLTERVNEEDAPLSPMAETHTLLQQFRKQPCEAYGRLLFASLLRWTPVTCWTHFGLVCAVYDHMREVGYIKGGVLAVYFAIIRAAKSRYAPTWNDYQVTRWLLRRDAQYVAELHRRLHLKGPRWAPVATSASWALVALRDQYEAFDLDYVAVVHCEECATRPRGVRVAGLGV